MIIYNMITNPN